MTDFRLSLPEASLNAHDVDIAFLSVFAIAAAIFIFLFILLVIFAVRYRRGSRAPRGPLPKLFRRELEIGWTLATIFLAIFIFWWFVGGYGLPPRDAPGQLEIHVVAKQWMWKTQHPNGAREIDALHIPVNTQIRLVMTSQDVIHSFYVPAFRLKQDVLPVRSTELVFTPAETGTFELFCAEYCGTQHSHMTGEIVVMTAPAYAAWLGKQPHGDTLVQQGEALYAKYGCGACHAPASHVHAPKLAGIYGSIVVLQTGAQLADDAYLRKSILRPRDDIVAGYAPIMPSYGRFASPADVDALLAYIKSLPTQGTQR
ncbi:MAG TPA: cytochrome c oxidase subunit II [Rhizomicrobium sp.]|jgi:cytochrome c oxidase subunit 2|nr:cytochrome c oxidase subunit II [Rhizomicrobium sp.]